MVYLTGDTHNEFTRLSNKYFKKYDWEIGENDYIIVCGDLGLCWSKDKTFEWNCKWFAEKPYTLLWVQGNHENYDMIDEYPIEKWHGGNVRHIVRDKVILLERGQIFNIEGKTFFTFGGASSHDTHGGILDRTSCEFEFMVQRARSLYLPYRIIGESWWSQELPSEEEMQEGLLNLQKTDYKVDYVITHCCATELQNKIMSYVDGNSKPDILTDYLQELESKLEYKHWYFGHYHHDFNVDENHTLLYKKIINLDEQLPEYGRVPIIGMPKFKRNDMVVFKFRDDEKCDMIQIVDAYGTFEQDDEPSYDICVEEENCLYKHIRETDIVRKAC